MAQNDKQNTVVFKSSVPLLPESLHSYQNYQLVFLCGKETTAFFQQEENISQLENAAVTTTFPGDVMSFFVFPKLVKSAVYVAGPNLEVFSRVCQTLRPGWILRHELLLWFCTYLCTFFLQFVTVLHLQ